MKRIAIFSDIHGNLQALESIVKDIDRYSFDEVIFLGDILGSGPNPKECLRIFMDSKIKVIKGNHEIYQIDDEKAKELLTEDEYSHMSWIKSQLNDEEMNYLKELPIEYEELIDGKLFTFAHFFLNEKKDYYRVLNILSDNRIYDITGKEETDYMFMGHSHDDFQIHNKSLFTCVGSSGCTKDNTTFYTVLEVNNGIVKMYKQELYYDRKSFEREVLKEDYPDRARLVDIFFGIKINKF